MANPVIETICTNIETAINAITTANSFQQDLNAVRPKRTDFRNEVWDDLDAIISMAEAEEVLPTAMEKTWRQNFEILVFAIDSDDETDSIDTRLNKIHADIEKKLIADGTRGSNAIDTNMTGRAPFRNDETAMAGISVFFWVEYRTQIGDPYTAA
jgi:hypothetical protein